MRSLLKFYSQGIEPKSSAVLDVVSALVSGVGGLSIAPITLPTDKKLSGVAQLLNLRSSWGRTRYGKVWHRRCRQK
ncbi:hypothetical protein QUA27_19470 [Microcoleus sp. Pol14C6]|uniref:hypothetical protein n=1 Tax=unclassified Microcoleus TaxID=2642155 RepID=UPI002FD4FC9E